MFQNIKYFTKYFRIPIALNRNKYSTNKDCTSVTVNHVNKVKSEEEIQKIISVKMKEYQELLKTQSPENNEISSQINVLESKLRKSYGFPENEDLTVFPVFKFQEPIIDNQLDFVQEKIK
ncbi:Hypothetical protein CINCED_3A013914 [Cinara cedri]|uniref:ATP synthase-coupling factor 6, mitochondrial n=1 Tax=Cinara cedri TaxID=506608 RepID=A0A5E4MJ77_9HEMI|nr:Hypothetical protein CINCED_3A013914 [Cinara cedri]